MNNDLNSEAKGTGRALGIDFGKRRIGIALSDPEKRIAFPHSVIENEPDVVRTILELCHTNSVDLVVVGESKDFSGQDNPVMHDIRRFVAEFNKLLPAGSSLVPIYEPETLSSHQVSKIQGDSENVDSGAASIILQSYLNRLKYKNE
jgi:putative Holliday junction resolvase